jgi:hypothetical protein
MSDIAAVSGPGAGRLDGSVESAPRATAARDIPGRIERPSDRVELSDRARLLSRLAGLPPVRQDLIDRVRDEIARGDYDTPGRLDLAIENLADDLNLMS